MIIVTASDERYFELAKELILSIKACWPAPVPIGFVDLGVRPQQRAWLVSQGVLVEPPRTKFNLDRLVDDASSKIGYLARPFINEIFSGHAMYVWLDADVWLQSWDGIQRLHDGAAARGAAMARENEKAYRWWMWMYCWQIKHLALGIGSVSGAAIWLLPHINNGVFAMRADAPHWTSWRKYFQRALNRTQPVIPYDQMPECGRLSRSATDCVYAGNLQLDRWSRAPHVEQSEA